ncbi:uncharacterized protein C1orf226 homolog [Aulostomus maculatus]
MLSVLNHAEHLHLPFHLVFSSPTVDQSMFENSVAQQQSPQTFRPGQPSARRAPASANQNLAVGPVDSPSSGGQQRLKNAINLGKAVGAKMNDLLRRKESCHLGDIGVTEVNKNVGAVWSCMEQLSQASANSHISFDSFPRLDPPPPSGKKRLPRALKTTQDMMISSDPVVSSPDAADSSSFLSSPDKTPLITKEELRNGEEEEQQQGRQEEDEETSPLGLAERKVDSETMGSNGKDEVTEEEDKRMEGGVEEHQHQLQLSVPDLINKDPPLLEPRAKTCDTWQKPPGPDSRLASTPCSGKTPCRISLGEEVLLGNGSPCGKGNGVSVEDGEPHPDLLSFE